MKVSGKIFFKALYCSGYLPGMELAHFAGGEKRNQKYAEAVMAEKSVWESRILQLYYTNMVLYNCVILDKIRVNI